MILRAKSEQRSYAIRLFSIQVALNALWSIIFFGMHAPALALVDIALLWAFIAIAVQVFGAIRPLAGILLYPYLAWVSFATILNAGIVILN
jgi:translocator protein